LFAFDKPPLLLTFIKSNTQTKKSYLNCPEKTFTRNETTCLAWVSSQQKWCKYEKQHLLDGTKLIPVWSSIRL